MRSRFDLLDSSKTRQENCAFSPTAPHSCHSSITDITTIFADHTCSKSRANIPYNNVIMLDVCGIDESTQGRSNDTSAYTHSWKPYTFLRSQLPLAIIHALLTNTATQLLLCTLQIYCIQSYSVVNHKIQPYSHIYLYYTF